MEHSEKHTLYAVSGQFTTLDGKPYVGPYHISGQGIPMTKAYHDIESAVLLPIQTKQTKQTPTLDSPDPNTVLNENATVYDLMPVVINKPPVIVKAVSEASTPQIKPYASADASGDFMYQFEDGTVRVHKDTTITLRAEAIQPNVLNVENGILEYKPSSAELVYSWTFDGESIGGTSVDSFTGGERIVNGNEVTITRIQPRFAGTYTCTVSNDIGTTDAGSVTLEVYNSIVDSYFYQNLLRNGNGSEDTSGWESINDGFVSTKLSAIDADTQKSIVINPKNKPFTWTAEMFNPRPYHLNFGNLRPESNPEAVNNMLNTNLQLTSYFTRVPYTYTVNNGIPVIRAYQDIDLSGEIEAHTRGAIYGVEGLRGVLCSYIGNGIFNYELNDEFITISERSDPASYYLGAPRLSVENFSKAGPGFIAEKVTITLQEFANNQPLESTILQGNTVRKGILTMTDPWTKRLPKYRGQVYYQGDKGYTVPDQPSLGDSRDAHLFVADELMPNYEDRYAFGQYAEFNKEVIERLDPRTTKIRVTINIEAPDLGVITRERGSDQLPAVSSNLKLWEIVPWISTWPSRSFRERNNDGGSNELSPFNQLRNNNEISSTDVFQRIPQMGESRALISGLTFALVPIYKDRIEVTNSEVESIFAVTEFLTADVLSPIQTDLPPYNAAEELEQLALAEIQAQAMIPVPSKYTLDSNVRIQESDGVRELTFAKVTQGPAQTKKGALQITQDLVDLGKSIKITANIVTYHNDRNNSQVRFKLIAFDSGDNVIGTIGDSFFYPTDVNENNRVTQKQNYTTTFSQVIEPTTVIKKDDGTAVTIMSSGVYIKLGAGAEDSRNGHNHTILADQSYIFIDFA
jgi:hypothetical protein